MSSLMLIRFERNLHSFLYRFQRKGKEVVIQNPSPLSPNPLKFLLEEASSLINTYFKLCFNEQTMFIIKV